MNNELTGKYTGKFLIASPTMEDPRFKKTVIFIPKHSPHVGAIGLVVNRAGGLTMSDVCEQLKLPTNEVTASTPIGWGGPMNAWLCAAPTVRKSQLGCVDLQR